MKWKLNKRNGISLIVLVITIIVMIILAAAIILSLSSSGIIGKAKEAKTTSDEATIKEVANLLQAEYELGVQTGEIDPSVTTVQAYVKEGLEKAGVDMSTVVVKDDGKVMVGLSKVAVAFVEAEVPVGTQVTGYTLSTAESAKTVSTDGSENTWDLDNFVETDPQPATGIKRDENITWSYIGIDENGDALIAGSVTSNSPTITLGGKGGYVNGPNTLNTICKTMYSSDMGTARSMNEEDVNMILGTNPVGEYRRSEGEYVDNPDKLTIGEIVSAGETALYNTSTPDGKDINTYVPNYYTISKSSVTASDTLKNLVYTGNTTTNPSLTARYWLASPCADVSFGGGTVWFRVYLAGSISVGSVSVFVSDDSSEGDTLAVRPIVSLASDVQVTYNGTTVSLS